MASHRVKERAPGEVLGARYELEALIGEGGMGQVWRAVHTVTRRRVALKLLKASDPSAKRRMVREAQAAALINHPAVVPVHDVLELDDGTSVLVMELLSGRTFRDVLAAEGALSPAQACAALQPVAAALAAASAAGIVHRDIKPENIFLVEEASATTVRVLDFGIAKMVGQEEVAGLTTREGTVMGTPFYMAPEQAFLDHPISSATDVWALGVVLYEAIAGQRPFGGETYPQLIRQLLEAKPQPLRECAPECPDELATLVDGCLSRAPETRPRLDAIAQSLARHAAGGRLSLLAPPKESLSLLSTEMSPPVRSAETLAAGMAATEAAPSRMRRRERSRARWIVAAVAVVALGAAGVASRVRSKPSAGEGQIEPAASSPPVASDSSPLPRVAPPKVSWKRLGPLPGYAVNNHGSTTESGKFVYVEGDVLIERDPATGATRELLTQVRGWKVAGLRAESVDLYRESVGVERRELGSAKVTRLYAAPVQHAWTSPDGRHVVVATRTGVEAVAAGGSERKILSSAQLSAEVVVAFDPAGSRVAFTTSARFPMNTLYIADLSTGRADRIDETVMTRGGVNGVVWPAAGWIVWSHGRGPDTELRAYPVDETGLRGQPVPVANEAGGGLLVAGRSPTPGSAILLASSLRFQVGVGRLRSGEPLRLEGRDAIGACDEMPSGWSRAGDLFVTRACGEELATWVLPGGRIEGRARMALTGSHVIETPWGDKTFWSREGDDDVLRVEGAAQPLFRRPVRALEGQVRLVGGPRCGGGRCFVGENDGERISLRELRRVDDTLRVDPAPRTRDRMEARAWSLSTDGATFAWPEGDRDFVRSRDERLQRSTMTQLDGIGGLAPLPRGGWLLTGSFEGAFRAVRVDEDRETVLFESVTTWVTAPTVSPDGTQVAVTMQPFDHELWQLTVVD